MSAISGLKDKVKEDIKNYCDRHHITLVEWVNSHIESDLQKEKEEEGKND